LLAAYYLQEFIRIQNHLGYNPNPHFSSDPADVRAIFDGNMNVETWAVFGNATYDLSDRFSSRPVPVTAPKRDVTSYQARRFRGTRRRCPRRWAIPGCVRRTGTTSRRSSASSSAPRRAHDLFHLGQGFQERHGGHRRGGQEFVDPEKVTSYEAGLKSRLLDNRLQLNLAAFYHEVEDAQFQFTFRWRRRPTSTQMRNAAQIEAKGVDSRWPGGYTGLHGRCLRGWLDSTFTSFLAPNR
jgi:iron complex outermembrane receptor protein